MRGVILAVGLMASSTWVMADEVKCLAKNIYFEARAESYAGKQAVANVTQNRLDSKDHPDSYCGVVK